MPSDFFQVRGHTNIGGADAYNEKHLHNFNSVTCVCWQVDALVQLVQHFGWSWVGVVAGDDAYGRGGASIFADKVKHKSNSDSWNIQTQLWSPYRKHFWVATGWRNIFEREVLWRLTLDTSYK